MLYLLDANTLIDADRYYYPLDRVPEFWGWLLWQSTQGYVRIPDEIYKELVEGHRGALVTWLKNHKATLWFDESVDLSLAKKVLDEGYGRDLELDELEKIGRDPFLVAHALKDPSRRSVVTTEISRPSRRRANRKVPNICSDFGVDCYHTFELIKHLDFRTNWNQI